ncbi:nucleotidyl transferase AbiEii/AbiGii toxin family protein [Kineococcus sp. R86509]|uniref:nucleotidyl transferase AbiEii/AbiGii toxin family protein n=1 Tax=Kineococcus sp. R86509 TaxID=3093851 RepID=UPI0036D25053
MTDLLAHQRHVTRLLLATTADRGFVLAGSGAIREHRMIQRPTEDVDLFTDSLDAGGFAEAVDAGTAALGAVGYRVEEVRRADLFARLQVSAEDGAVLEVDFAVDWREHPATTLEVGPVLSRDDAVANKVGALFSRAEARDFLDVDAIRRTGTYSDEELLALAQSHDDGFDRRLFAEQLRLVVTLTPRRVQQYGIGEEELSGVQDRLGAWARQLHG